MFLKGFNEQNGWKAHEQMLTKQYSDGALEMQKERYDAAHRNPYRKRSKLSIIIVMLVILVLAAGGNYLVARLSGTVLLPFGEEIACGEDYTRTTIRSLGFNVHKLEGSCMDYTVILPWGRLPESPRILAEEQIEQVQELLAREAASNLDSGFEKHFLPVETFTEIHVYYVKEVKPGVVEIGAAVSTGEYALYKDQVYVLEESTTPHILQVWDNQGKLSEFAHKDSIRGQDYWKFFFKDSVPEGLLFDFRDTKDTTEAREQRDAAAEAYFGGTITLDRLEVDGEGNLKIYRPDIEGFDPAADTELKYTLIESAKLKAAS